MSKLLPVQHHLEIYCDSEGDKAIMAFSASTPFAAVSVGDVIDPKAWEGFDHMAGGRLHVTNVEHLVWENKDSHIGHKVMVDTVFKVKK